MQVHLAKATWYYYHWVSSLLSARGATPIAGLARWVRTLEGSAYPFAVDMELAASVPSVTEFYTEAREYIILGIQASERLSHPLL